MRDIVNKQSLDETGDFEIVKKKGGLKRLVEELDIKESGTLIALHKAFEKLK